VELAVEQSAVFDGVAGAEGAVFSQLAIQADPVRLRQICDNLVGNALKFSPFGAVVQVAIKRGDGVRLEVKDQGWGLTADDRTTVFERFQRLSALPTGNESSSGLGLSLVRDLVVLHGGRLWVESEPGEGATFVAEFPRVEVDIA
jgi:signal transduction histidine kinase